MPPPIKKSKVMIIVPGRFMASMKRFGAMSLTHKKPGSFKLKICDLFLGKSALTFNLGV